jgi:hypothetical protein
MLRIFRYLKSLFVKKQANVKVVSPKEHEQKPTKYVARVVPNETQDIALHRSRNIPFVTELARQQTKTDDTYNHSVSSIINQPDSDILNNYWLDDNKPKHNHSDDYDRTPNHDVDYSRHNNHDYSPSHSDSSHSHHDYTPLHTITRFR